MNQLFVEVIDIRSNDILNIVTMKFDDCKITMLNLELPERVNIGSKLKIGFKPSHLSFAKNLIGEISFSNRIKTTIKEFECGELLCIVRLQKDNHIFESIITNDTKQRMNINIGDEVETLIKASEISILEVLSGN